MFVVSSTRGLRGQLAWELSILRYPFYKAHKDSSHISKRKKIKAG